MKARVAVPVLVPVFVFVFGMGGCKRGPAMCPPGTKATLEVRDGTGALTLAVKDGQICDSRMRALGTVAALKARVDAHLRLYRDAKELRVLALDGVPLGSVVPEGRLAAVYNPASQAIAKVSLRDADAVVTDLAGAAQTYLVPSSDAGAAGVFAIPRLTGPEAVAIYLHWSAR